MSLCFGSQIWPQFWSPVHCTAARQNLAHETINLSMGRLNQDGTRANPRRMEQRPRRNYHFGHRQTVIEAATKEIRNEYIRRLVCLQSVVCEPCCGAHVNCDDSAMAPAHDLVV